MAITRSRSASIGFAQPENNWASSFTSVFQVMADLAPLTKLLFVVSLLAGINFMRNGMPTQNPGPQLVDDNTLEVLDTERGYQAVSKVENVLTTNLQNSLYRKIFEPVSDDMVTLRAQFRSDMMYPQQPHSLTVSNSAYFYMRNVYLGQPNSWTLPLKDQSLHFLQLWLVDAIKVDLSGVESSACNFALYGKYRYVESIGNHAENEQMHKGSCQLKYTYADSLWLVIDTVNEIRKTVPAAEQKRALYDRLPLSALRHFFFKPSVDVAVKPVSEQRGQLAP